MKLERACGLPRGGHDSIPSSDTAELRPTFRGKRPLWNPWAVATRDQMTSYGCNLMCQRPVSLSMISEATVYMSNPLSRPLLRAFSLSSLHSSPDKFVSDSSLHFLLPPASCPFLHAPSPLCSPTTQIRTRTSILPGQILGLGNSPRPVPCLIRSDTIRALGLRPGEFFFLLIIEKGICEQSGNTILAAQQY